MIGAAAARIRASLAGPQSERLEALPAAIGLLACALAPDAATLDTCGRLLRDLAASQHTPARAALLLSLTAARAACAGSDEAQDALATAFRGADGAAAELAPAHRDEALWRGVAELLAMTAGWLDQTLAGSGTAAELAVASSGPAAVEVAARALAAAVGASPDIAGEGGATAVELVLRAAEALA